MSIVAAELRAARKAYGSVTALDGVRGRPAVDVVAAARVASALSRLDAEVEINPLLVSPGGAVALDARVAMERP